MEVQCPHHYAGTTAFYLGPEESVKGEQDSMDDVVREHRNIFVENMNLLLRHRNVCFGIPRVI